MQGAVLAYENAAVDRHDVEFRECFLQLTAGKLIVLGLPIGGHENSSVDDEEVCVGGWEAMPIVGVEDGIGHGKGK